MRVRLGTNSVKLISGSLSHENTGNQFGHASAIFTFILLSVTAVFQIICLNRGLKVYDSTLVVPVFYGVYTGAGFLDSLIFNNEVDAYRAWTLFLIMCSMVVLIVGVVLLTFKKPDPSGTGRAAALVALESGRGGPSVGGGAGIGIVAAERGRGKEGFRLDGGESGEGEVVWQLGEASDGEEDAEDAQSVRLRARSRSPRPGVGVGVGVGVGGVKGGEGERRRMLDDHEEEEEEREREGGSEGVVGASRGSTSADPRTLASHGYADSADEGDLLLGGRRPSSWR